MSPEDNYLFTLGHMYKHYIMEGCGVRFLCDMYLLRAKQPQMNMKYVQSMVAKMGISSFHQTVIGLAEAVFAGGELTDDGRQLLNDMFSGTVYGKGKTMAEKVDEHGGKGRYILSRLFPKSIHYEKHLPGAGKMPRFAAFLLSCAVVQPPAASKKRNSQRGSPAKEQQRGSAVINVLFVGLGGFVGAILRYLLGLIPVRQTPFPIITLCINVLGSLWNWAAGRIV